jgi:hypothetical protein
LEFSFCANGVSIGEPFTAQISELSKQHVEFIDAACEVFDGSRGLGLSPCLFTGFRSCHRVDSNGESLADGQKAGKKRRDYGRT